MSEQCEVEVVNENSTPDYTKRPDDVDANTMWKAVIEYGRDSTKTALLINAGAVIAILSLYTKVITTPNINPNFQSLIDILPTAMICYTGGALIAGLSAWVSYNAQIQYYKALYRSSELREVYNFFEPYKDELYSKYQGKGDKYREWALAFVACSYILFIISSCIIFCSLT